MRATAPVMRISTFPCPSVKPHPCRSGHPGWLPGWPPIFMAVVRKAPSCSSSFLALTAKPIGGDAAVSVVRVSLVKVADRRLEESREAAFLQTARFPVKFSQFVFNGSFYLRQQGCNSNGKKIITKIITKKLHIKKLQ